jgi:NADP-dependent 3-hydroxy acid dehydrogenase YdfG
MASSADLEGRRVLVTGASGGIGRALVTGLASAGARVVLVARGEARIEALAHEVGGTAIAADVADVEAVAALRDRVSRDDPPWAVVNACGSFDLAPIAETDPAVFDRMVDGNLRGPFLVIRAFLPAMLEAGTGHVVTVGSVAGRVAFPGNGAYSAAKFGIRGLHAVLDQELRGTGVRATLVEPAATDTSIWDPLDPDGDPGLPDRTAMLSPDAVADTVLFAITRPPGVQIPLLAVQRS